MKRRAYEMIGPFAVAGAVSTMAWLGFDWTIATFWKISAVGLFGYLIGLTDGRLNAH